jgi:hypothetical protein
MKNVRLVRSLLFVISFFLSLTAYTQQTAFPGAEGFGMYTTGGRGGQVIKVTNLNDSGAGSLRAAIEATGPRIVVFEVSGTIELASTLTISNDDITIAGQTAPGDGICVRNYSVSISASNVIIRYMRFRLGDKAQQVDDAARGRFQKNIIIDHCSMSWSIDECASFYANENFTMQWCLLTESLRNSIHYGAHGFGGIWGGNRASFHHNLLAHHSNRNPRFRGHKLNSSTDAEHVDLRNNVIYNYDGITHGSEGGGRYNMVNNYYKAGPATNNPDQNLLEVIPGRAQYNSIDLEGAHGIFYVHGNYFSSNQSFTNDNWNGVEWDVATTLERVKSEKEFEKGNITTDDAETAYQKVLDYVGASIYRDAVDERTIQDTRTGTATVMDGGNGSTNGYIDTQEAVGGWPVLNSLPAPVDTDGDGMPDEWELANGLNPNDPDDGNEDRTNDGYTNIEEYINSLALDYFDTEPIINLVQPQKNQVFLGNADTSIHVEAYANDYNGGVIVKMELYLDNELVREYNDSTRIITTLENVSPGMHHITIKSTDDSGKTTEEKTTIYVGQKEVRINVEEGPNGQVVLEPPGGIYSEGIIVQGWIKDIESTRNDLQIPTENNLTIKPVFVKDSEKKNKWSYPLKINFQPEEDYAIPNEYIPDYGGVLNEKWTGYTYGWLEGYHPFNGLNLGISGAWRTFRYFEWAGNKNSWGIELPKGIYRIRLGLGGKVLLGFPVETELKINAEGIVVEDNDGVDLLDENILDRLPVLDGQLTLTSVEQSRICFIEIELQQLVSPRTLAVENGSGDGEYYPDVDDEVMIMADPPLNGQVFDKWIGDIAHLEDIYSSSTFVAMPDTNVNITATYKAAPAQEGYYVSVVGGSGTGYYAVGTQVEISAPDTIFGGDFSHWESDCPCIIDFNEKNRTISFSTVAANVVFEPVYEMREPQTDNDIYQAEHANFDEKSTVERYYGGYYGLGYVNFGNNSGSYVQFNNIDGKEGGLSAIKLRYSLNDKDREGVIIVNGVQDTFAMAETKSWTEWGEVEVVVELEPGEQNTIRVETIGDDLGYFDQIEVKPLGTTGFVNDPIKPLMNIVCYPNPFSDYATISFELRNSSDVIIQLYNLQGQIVKQICNRHFLPGINEVKLGKEDLMSGLYILRVSSKLSQQSLKIIID